MAGDVESGRPLIDKNEEMVVGGKKKIGDKPLLVPHKFHICYHMIELQH
jgi:hypothetical protein